MTQRHGSRTRWRRTKTSPRLATAGEVAAAPLSYLFYRATRFCVQLLVQLDGRRHPEQCTTWRTLDGSTVGKPFNLLALMTSAPRWNTHAVISLAGPLQVRRTIRLDAATATASAASWTVVVHAEPSHRIVASIGSVDGPCADPWRTLVLPSGSYRLALRYYGCADPVVLPAVEVDDLPTVAAVAIPADTNAFYRDIVTGTHYLYVGLHSYVCTLLRFRRWVPSAFLAREYLPAGNPQTTFRYGFIPAGSAMDIWLDSDVLETHDVYVTVYDRASFPIMWSKLSRTCSRTPRTAVDGSYLLRCHARASTSRLCEPDHVRVRVRVTPDGDQTVRPDEWVTARDHRATTIRGRRFGPLPGVGSRTRT